MRWCSGLSLVPIKVKILQGPGSNPGPNHGGLFFGLFMGFLDFLLAPFNNLWYYIIVQWSKTHQKCVIVLIAWSWQNYDHCAMLVLEWVSALENWSKLLMPKSFCLSILPTFFSSNSFSKFLFTFPQLQFRLPCSSFQKKQIILECWNRFSLS